MRDAVSMGCVSMQPSIGFLYFDGQGNVAPQGKETLYRIGMELQEWISAARKFKGLTQEALGTALGTSKQNVNAWEKGRHEPSYAQIMKIMDMTGYPFLPHDKRTVRGLVPTQTEAGTVVAQPVSLPVFDTVPSIAWEEIKVHGLPAKFETVVPDDSMAPRVRQGQAVTFETGLTPRPGDGVLIRDNDGHHYLRIYKQRRTGSWEAHADNDAYQPLESERDGLEVVGVLVAVHARWG